MELHMDNIINNFEAFIEIGFDYDRDDKDFFYKIRVIPNILYNDSDKMFY